MLKRLLCYCQFILPQHLLSVFAGQLANSKVVWLKNLLIDKFSKYYQIDLSEALIKNPHDYPSFNEFFTRALDKHARPIASDKNGLVSPADGSIAQMGTIAQQRLFQAKGLYFSLDTLLGNHQEASRLFNDGHFATIYLAPHNYHRVHMPISGRLIKSIYIPGKLFSVNQMTASLIPNLYGRNERLVLIFETEFGPLAVILVGALIVGSIKTIWMDKPFRSNQIEITTPTTTINLAKGDLLGQFELGSTVILLLPNRSVTWNIASNSDNRVLMGQLLLNFTSS